MTSKATGPKTEFAGVLLEASPTRLRASMAVFSAERLLPRPFGRSELSVMVESQDSDEKDVRCEGCEKAFQPK